MLETRFNYTVLRDGSIQETLPTILVVRPGSADQISNLPSKSNNSNRIKGKPGWLGLSGTAVTPEIAQAMGLPPGY